MQQEVVETRNMVKIEEARGCGRAIERECLSGGDMDSPTPTGIDVCLFRERILDVAEEHFRRIGHQKTSVDDMAVHLGVSRANIYRFFPSRSAINKSVCGRFLNRTILFCCNRHLRLFFESRGFRQRAIVAFYKEIVMLLAIRRN